MTAGWGFTTSNPTDARYGDDVAKYAMSDGDQGVKTFVREVLQNSNDAQLDNDEPAQVTFRLETLEGDELKEYLESIDGPTWSDHAKMAASTESGNHIEEAMRRIRDEQSLRILTIEDQNTEGLLGAETADESNFTALVRDVLFSSKSGETAGGSYGLGKAVLWLFSGLSMVMFNSSLSQPDPREDSPRLVGRTRLPTHKSEDGNTVYQGHGWFGEKHRGVDDGTGSARPESVWGDRATELAESLHLTRPEQPGTSIQVVDFRVPTAEERLEDDELAKQITQKAIEWFWPAIFRDNLEVTVEAEGETYEATLETNQQYKPFASCLEDREQTVDALNKPGDIVESNIGIEVPEKTDGTDGTDGDLSLLARRARSDELDKQNSVAFVRGAGMVVEYYDRDRIVVGNEDFHAVLLGGKARVWGTDSEPTDDDTTTEEFLTAAEPPRHDEWIRTETLANTYSRGFRKAVEGIKSDVTDRLRTLVAPNVDRGTAGPERLGNRFRIGNKSRGGRSTQKPSPSRRVSGETRISFDKAYDHWVFEGKVEPTDRHNRIREVTVSLVRMGEERVTNDRLPIETISAKTTDVSVSLADKGGAQIGQLTPKSPSKSIAFEGYSENDPRQVETRLKVSVDIVSGGEL